MRALIKCWLALLATSLLSFTAATDPWATLGLQRGTDDEAAIKRAYRSLALKLHPDKNPSLEAQEQWLQVQAAYEELTERGADPFTRLFREHPPAWADAARQRAAQQAAWRVQQARQRERTRIESAAEELDSSAFARRVLAGDQRPDGRPWVVQLYAHDSPFCRALSSQWEASLREVGTLLSFGRIDLHEQPMLVRFVASHLRRLFRSPQPWRELPLVFGLPRGCYSMRCAVVFGDQLTSQRLQRWAGTHLLHLPALPPLSSRLLGHWCRAVPDGQLGVLAVLQEGQPQPLHLLEEVRKAQGSVRAAAAVWRPADRAVWLSAVGAASPPFLVLCKGPASGRRLVAAKSSSLKDSSAWRAELQQQLGPQLSRVPSRPAGLLALAAAHALLATLHAASRLELAARRCTQSLRNFAGDISWQTAALAVLGLASLWGFKRLLDAFSDEEYAADGSPVSKPRGVPRRVAAGSSGAAGRVREMRHSDWEPTPGRFVVVLPLLGGQKSSRDGNGGGSSAGSCLAGAEAAGTAAARQRLETLAALFQSERRLLFRVAPVSNAFAQLVPAAAGAQAEGRQQQQQLVAYVLHPRRGRCQLLPLTDTQAAVLRLEELLDGCGTWLAAAR